MGVPQPGLFAQGLRQRFRSLACVRGGPEELPGRNERGGNRRTGPAGKLELFMPVEPPIAVGFHGHLDQRTSGGLVRGHLRGDGIGREFRVAGQPE